MAGLTVKERDGGLFLSAAIVVICLLLFAGTPWLITNFRADVPYFESPAFYPRLALAVAILGGVAHFRALKAGKVVLDDGSDEFEVGDARTGLAIAGLALFIGYLVLVPVIGYAPATFLFCAVSSRLAGLGTGVSVAMAAGIAALLYGIFVIVLKVWFPQAAILGLFAAG